MVQGKRPGPKPVAPYLDISKRAYDIAIKLRLLQNQIDWDVLFRAPRSIQNIKKAFVRAEQFPEMRDLWEQTQNGLLILDWLKEEKFPQTDLVAKMRHLAESIGGPSLIGRGKISLRRSRDICLEKRERGRGTILRVDFYIECSCRYKGPAKDGRCPRCGATIPADYHRLLSLRPPLSAIGSASLTPAKGQAPQQTDQLGGPPKKGRK